MPGKAAPKGKAFGLNKPADQKAAAPVKPVMPVAGSAKSAKPFAWPPKSKPVK